MIETVLMSTHSICFGCEIKRIKYYLWRPAFNSHLFCIFSGIPCGSRFQVRIIFLFILFMEWIVRLVQGMYANARSRVRVGEGFSKEFEVKVGVHQGSVLSPLLFIIVLEALSREFRAGVPWEDLYADDLVIIADSLEECVRRLLIWKEAMEKKGLRVNAGKTKVMICGTGLDLLQSSGEYPCAVCRTGVGNNSIYCNHSVGPEVYGICACTFF